MNKAIVPSKNPKEIVKEIAADIGKEVVAHIEMMYPAAIQACPSTFKLSVRGCVINNIMAAIEVHEEGAIFKRLAERKKFRRKMVKAYRDLRK